MGLAAAYQGAVEAVLAVVIAAGAGYWIDSRFDTSPVGLLIGVTLGFAAFFLRLWRMRDLMTGSAGGGGEPPEQK